MRRLLPTLPLLAVLAFAGCGGSSSSSKSNKSQSRSTDIPANVGSVSMQGIAFKPKTLTVPKGQKVTWTNGEDVQHNVVAKKGASFKSKLFGKGGTYSYTPKKAGTIEYECTVHPGMEGTLKVQ